MSSEVRIPILGLMTKNQAPMSKGRKKIDIPVQSENNFTFPVTFVFLVPLVC